MALLRVDLSDAKRAIAGALPGHRDVRKMLRALGAAARAEWISQASDNLTSTSRDYIEGISQPVVGDRSVTIQLTGVVPNMVEEGWPETDLRKTVLRGPHVKHAKDGHKYMSVPFRHGAPGTGGRNVGSAMPKPIHNVAKFLAATQSAPALAGLSGRKDPGARLSVLSPRMNQKAKTILESKDRDWHSTSIYTGMIRQVASYGRNAAGKTTMQSSYKTFRTISERVSNGPRHWMHPGIKARRLASKVQAFVQEVAGKIIQDAAGGGKR